MGEPCDWCATHCADIDLTPLLNPHTTWLWQQLADTADRRGDPALRTGTTTVTAPDDAIQRAATTSLLGGRAPAPGQTIRINLGKLTEGLRRHHPDLHPGLVAAHATRRRLAERARHRAQRHDATAELRRQVAEALDRIPAAAPFQPAIDRIWPALQRNGWVARLLARHNTELLVNQAAAVIGALPPAGRRCDRRRLADDITRYPHALDTGTLPGLVLAILGAAGALQPGLAVRAAWAALGVDGDDLTGGLLTLGVHPTGWSLPTAAVVTIPPRELVTCTWPAPPRPDSCVFITENPSVVSAAADLRHPGIRLLCTVGTPSAREIAAVARLADVGWQIAVRADFDTAGLHHVRAALDGVPGARPWRMDAETYLTSLARSPEAIDLQLSERELPLTPWDPSLRRAMTDSRRPAYEEALIETLLEDLLGAATAHAIEG
ncbi:DUF2399 domain-containing protein [Catenuloplanes indicus]|uniref:Uncharacterized protein (TIGR02679 family) n=1 Tax=Catenuloplanes indicus TaxID=137267 RepID=A0AAE3VWK0_9ACTN|nr:DUF2399 domain-containing protein [Catenuloplanes indicus]MDQ0365064.1 uncharacterized protein (TIGR02679 family) [Catenuloplanes indicus]